MWPPREKVGAEERSPSTPLLGPSIVKEREGEAPRVEAGEPHSPVPLPSGEGFASFKDLFAPRSLLFEAHSPLAEPSEEERMELAGLFESCTSRGTEPDSWGMSHSPLFGSHSLGGTPSDFQGMPLEKRFQRLEIPSSWDCGRLPSCKRRA